jgi:hypothetical protein
MTQLRLEIGLKARVLKMRENTRADKFLEGFKLGKLGAGKIHFAEPTPVHEEPKVKILQDGGRSIVHKSGGLLNAYHIYWRDPDGFDYYLELKPNIEGNPDFYMMSFYGGVNSITDKDNITDVMFRCDRADVGFDEAVKHFHKKLKPLIKAHGAEGLLHEPIVTDYTFAPSMFRQWLHEKQREIEKRKK